MYINSFAMHLKSNMPVVKKSKMASTVTWDPFIKY